MNRENEQEKRESEKAMEEFVKSCLIDNSMDSIAAQINRIYVKINEAGEDRQEIAGKWAKKLRKLYIQGETEMKLQQEKIASCIQLIESDQRKGRFEGRNKKRRRESVTKKAKESKLKSPLKDETLPKGTQVAAKVARSHDLWILASIVKYLPQNKSYEVEDEDSGDEGDGSGGHRHHIVPYTSVIGLPQMDQEMQTETNWLKYPVETRVMAMYPNTTSFYPAIVQVPNPLGSPYVIVRFEDDADETGAVPDRKVPLRFVAKFPT